MDTPLVEMRDICISFGGVHAVDHLSVDLHPGEVVGLPGHNGAGKSTLVKILSGAYTADSGEILINGERAEIHNPRDVRRYNIETICQTLALADNLDAASNLFLGRELITALGLVDDAAMEAETRWIMARLNPDFHKFSDPVSALSGGQRQAVAIARAVYFDARILIMDEPTAALGPQETRMVAELIGQLKAEGCHGFTGCCRGAVQRPVRRYWPGLIRRGGMPRRIRSNWPRGCWGWSRASWCFNTCRTAASTLPAGWPEGFSARRPERCSWRFSRHPARLKNT